MDSLINEVKSGFRTEILYNDPKSKHLENLKVQIKMLELPQTLLGETKNEKKERDSKRDKLKIKVDKLAAEIEEIKSNKIYENAFEWRFEFPEVLNDLGEFEGFNCIIGNPPYINANDLKKRVGEVEYKFYKDSYKTAKGTVDLYIYFFELAHKLLSKNSLLSYITPNRYLSVNYAVAIRNFLINNFQFIQVGDYSDVRVFSEASTYPVVSIFKKKSGAKDYKFKSFTYSERLGSSEWREFNSQQLKFLNDNILGFILSSKFALTEKVINQSTNLSDVGTINATSSTADAENFHSLISEKINGFKLINTGTIDRYTSNWGLDYLTDKGKKFLNPYLPKSESTLGKNRFTLYSIPKIIFAKIAIRTEAFYDSEGTYASVNTNCIHSFTDEYDPLYVLGWVNSKLFQYIFECFFDGLKMSGGYLLYSAPTLNNMYIKKPTIKDESLIVSLVNEINQKKILNRADSSMKCNACKF
jgi:hypothetical protein